MDLETKKEQYNILIQLAIQFINVPLDQLDSALGSAMKKLGEYVGADRFYIFSYDWENGTGTNTHEWCAPGIEPQIQTLQNFPLVEFSEWIEWHKQGKIHTIEDVSALPTHGNLRKMLLSQSILSLIAAPIFYDGTCLGFIGMDWVRTRKQFTDEEQSLLQIFSEMIANVRNRLNSLKELQKTKDALLRNEERYQSVVESSDSAILMYDKAGTVLFMNGIAAALYQKTPEDLVGKNVYDLFPSDQAIRILNDISLVFSEGQGKVLYTEVDIAGERKYFRTSLQPVKDAHRNIYAVLVYASDLTYQKEFEHKLALSENKYKKLFENSPEAYLIFSNGIFIECNKAAEIMLGCSRIDILGKSPIEFSPEFQRNGRLSIEYAQEVVEEAWEKKEIEFEWELFRFDGTRFITLVNLTVLEYNEEPVLLVTWRDITERKKLIDSLQLYQERYSQALAHSRAVVWEVDLDGRFTYMSPVSSTVFGYNPSEIEGKMMFYDFHPMDVRDYFRKRGFEIMQGEKPTERLDNPIVCKDGRILWVSTIGVSLFGPDGNRTGYRCVDFDITDRHAAEQESLMFREVLKQANYGAAINTLDGKFLFINNAFAEMHGYTVDELMDKNLSVFHSEEQLPRVESLIHEMKLKGEFRTQEVWHQHRDGFAFPTLMSGVVIKDELEMPAYISATALDITEMKAKEAEIQKLMIAIEQSPVALLITDLNANITYVSPAFTQITGYSKEETIGKNARFLKSDLNPPELYADLWNTITSGKTWQAEWVNTKKNGDVYPERVNILPIYDHKGKVSNYLAIKQDISDRRQAEEDRIAKESADSANRMKSLFLANMSHEIRTPLNAVIGFAQILKRDKTLSDKQSQQVGTILRSGEHLLSLINDILDLSKIEAGRITLKESGFTLKNLLTDVHQMFSLRAEEKRLKFTVEYDKNIPEFVSADEAKIRQILINIVGNALKFTDFGSIKINVQSRPRIAMNMGDTRTTELSISVTDTGAGIAAEEQELIFNAFQQSFAPSQNLGGTGLGLTISRRLAEFMGGNLTVQSELNQGSTFTLRLPVIAAKYARKKELTNIYDGVIGLEPGQTQVRILVTDDISENNDLIRDMLQPLGFEIKSAVNGLEAIEFFHTWKPDAILMDLRMPGLDGFEATRTIRKDDKGGVIPIFAVTASTFEDDIRLQSEGFTGYIRKPFTLSQLLSEFATHLNLKYKFSQTEIDPMTSSLPDEVNSDFIPTELRERILSAIHSGNSVRLKTLLKEIEAIDIKLYNHTFRLAQQFDYDSLLSLFALEDGI